MACGTKPPPPGNPKNGSRKNGIMRLCLDRCSELACYRQGRRVSIELRLGFAGHHVIGEKRLIEVRFYRFHYRGRSERGHRDPISAARAGHDFPVTDQGFARDATPPSSGSSTPCRPCGRRHASPAFRKPAPGGPAENQIPENSRATTGSCSMACRSSSTLAISAGNHRIQVCRTARADPR